MATHKLTRYARKRFRSRRRQVEHIGSAAEDQLEYNFLRKWGNLRSVWRFTLSWLMLIVLLIGLLVVQTRALNGYYKSLQPAPGGIYSEGIVGAYTNANPLYASGQVNDAVSKLIFASLFKHNDHNNLVGDLATDWQVDNVGTTYTVHLRKDISWHDGYPLTADDVVFTYRTIQNPDTQSPLAVSWQGVNVTAQGSHTVIFKLPNPLSSFPYSLTNGIIPKHILQHIPNGELRSADYNTAHPIGAGPFMLKTIDIFGNTPKTRQVEIALKPFDGYHGGKPKLSSFVLHTFSDNDQMTDAFRKRIIAAMAGSQELPSDLGKDEAVQQYSMPLTAANMVFFKTSSGVLHDPSVRQALVGGANPLQITRNLGYRAMPVREPLLQSQVGYNPAYQQLNFGAAKAADILNQNGWILQSDGIRAKNGQPLSFKLYAQNTPAYAQATKSLRDQWKKLGVDAQIYLQADIDLHSTVTFHNYDALLYGISIGVDPDVFVYWHSSQADVRSPARLNLSEYVSPVADASLEAGRTRTDAVLRSIKYQSFLQAWQQDAPALGLYQPRFLYITQNPVYGLTEHTLTTDTDRFNNVENWMIRQTLQQVIR